mmetsp:Transcript_23240/g.56059  ORF Transcript_23240/g.56059 Transcript_23240/m.56059 type:complete len:201 (+) Transcript_23240:54-656(+)
MDNANKHILSTLMQLCKSPSMQQLISAPLCATLLPNSSKHRPLNHDTLLIHLVMMPTLPRLLRQMRHNPLIDRPRHPPIPQRLLPIAISRLPHPWPAPPHDWIIEKRERLEISQTPHAVHHQRLIYPSMLMRRGALPSITLGGAVRILRLCLFLDATATGMEGGWTHTTGTPRCIRAFMLRNMERASSWNLFLETQIFSM